MTPQKHRSNAQGENFADEGNIADANASCGFHADVQAYFDDALPPARRAAFARHLNDCAICIGELATLANISRIIGAFPKAPQPFVWRMRGTDFLRDARRNAYSQAVLRIAGGAVGIAAAVLLASGIWSSSPAPAPTGTVANVTASAPWESAVLSDSNGNENPDNVSADVSQAQWVASALDTSSSHD